MNTKLTLSIDDEVIEKAKEYARAQGRSISDIIENYLKLLTQEKEQHQSRKPSVLRDLKGSYKLPEEKTYKEILRDQLNSKYGD